MMDDMMKLARRAVACDGWRWWMPGMRLLTFDAGHRYAQRVRDDGSWGDGIDPLPDLTDPATLGCVLALVAERHGVTLDDVHVVRTTGRVWSAWVFDSDGASRRVATHLPSRAAALVAALEAAPVGGAS